MLKKTLSKQGLCSGDTGALSEIPTLKFDLKQPGLGGACSQWQLRVILVLLFPPVLVPSISCHCVLSSLSWQSSSVFSFGPCSQGGAFPSPPELLAAFRLFSSGCCVSEGLRGFSLVSLGDQLPIPNTSFHGSSGSS